jgi:hypothetical protein
MLSTSNHNVGTNEPTDKRLCRSCRLECNVDNGVCARCVYTRTAQAVPPAGVVGVSHALAKQTTADIFKAREYFEEIEQSMARYNAVTLVPPPRPLREGVPNLCWETSIGQVASPFKRSLVHTRVFAGNIETGHHGLDRHYRKCIRGGLLSRTVGAVLQQLVVLEFGDDIRKWPWNAHLLTHAHAHCSRSMASSR